MWKRLVALAAVAFVSCVQAQEATLVAPLSLDDALTRVARHHPELRLHDARRPIFEARQAAAELGAPLTLGIDLENALGSGQSQGLRSAELTVSLAGVIERGGKLDARRLIAQSNLNALAPQREIARLDLMAEVARRYLAVAEANQQRTIAATDIEQRRRAVSAARQRLQAGASPESVLLTAQAMLAQAELDGDRASQMLWSARIALSALWQQAEPDFEDATGNPLHLPALADFAVLAEELQRTPELAALVSERRVREAQLQLARSQSHPDVGWQLGVRNLRETGDVALVAALSMPLGSTRRAEAGIREAEAELALTGLERESRNAQLYATLAQAHGRYLASRLEVMRMGSEVLPRLQRAESAAEKAWRSGAVSYMEWAQLQAMRIEARQRQLDAAIAAQTALIEIQRLTGQSMLAGNADAAVKESL